VISSTAELTLDRDEYGPFAKVIIDLYDPDLALPDQADVPTYPDTRRLIQTDLDTIDSRIVGDEAIYANKSKEDIANVSGTFRWEMYLNGTETGVGWGVDSEPIDDLYVYYVDDANDDGDEEVIAAHALIRSHTGVIALDKSTYNVGEWINITVTDEDMNIDSDIMDILEVEVKTEAWPMGMDVILEETGDSTGVFDQLVLVTDELPEGNQIWGKIGNTLTVTYEDDFDATGEELDVVATARIGVVLEYPVPAIDPMVVDSAGMPIEAPAVGQLLVIQMT
jgi:hypothetical protein